MLGSGTAGPEREQRAVMREQLRAWRESGQRSRDQSVVQVQVQNIISDNAFLGPLKVRLDKWRPLHAIIQVVLVVAEESLKVRLEAAF